MSNTARKLIVEFLKQMSEELGRNGCNDYELDNTPENREFMAGMLAWSFGDPEDQKIQYSSDKKKIYTLDFCVVDYLVHLLKEEKI